MIFFVRTRQSAWLDVVKKRFDTKQEKFCVLKPLVSREFSNTPSFPREFATRAKSEAHTNILTRVHTYKRTKQFVFTHLHTRCTAQGIKKIKTHQYCARKEGERDYEGLKREKRHRQIQTL